MSENSQLIVSKRENSGTGHSRSIRQKKKKQEIKFCDKKKHLHFLIENLAK